MTAATTLAPPTRRTKSSKIRSASAARHTAGEVVLQALQAKTKALRKAERKVRDGDQQAVSQTRVAARQLRSTLRGFSRLLDRQVTRPPGQRTAQLMRRTRSLPLPVLTALSRPGVLHSGRTAWRWRSCRWRTRWSISMLCSCPSRLIRFARAFIRILLSDWLSHLTMRRQWAMKGSRP